MTIELDQAQSAQREEPADFQAVANTYRRELLAHCYRMTGSAHEAEDLVQETFLRAWKAYHSFEGRSSVRTWLYRIATNVCLTNLEGRPRRGARARLQPAGVHARPAAPAGPAARRPRPARRAPLVGQGGGRSARDLHRRRQRRAAAGTGAAGAGAPDRGHRRGSAECGA